VAATSVLAMPLCDRLGIQLPIVQAPIGSAATPELVAAVANAGGLGMLAFPIDDLLGACLAEGRGGPARGRDRCRCGGGQGWEAGGHVWGQVTTMALGLAAAPEDAVYTRCFDGGWPDAAHRAIRNPTITACEAAGRPSAPGRPGEGEVVATDRQGRPQLRYSVFIAG
jgi:hypothetical protein